MKTEFILKGISSCKSFNLENHDSDNLQGLIKKVTHPANLLILKIMIQTILVVAMTGSACLHLTNHLNLINHRSDN